MHEEILKKLFKQYFKEESDTVIQLPQAGSDRIYFRLESEHHSAVGTYGKDTKENETFIHHTKHFHQKLIAVPQVYCVSEDKEYYLQQDLGETSLYAIIKNEGVSENVIKHLKEVLQQLTYLQIRGAEHFNFETCYPIQEFNRSSMFWDLNSFKYYFARVARVHFSEVELNNDFNTLCNYLLEEPNATNATCETVDKIYYRSSDKITLTPTFYKLDGDEFYDSDGDPLSDHRPMNAKFTYKVNN